MKIKVNFFDKRLLKNYFALLSAISVILSFILIAVEIPDEDRLCVGIIFLILLLIIYILMWVMANRLTSINININNSTVSIKSGNIFEEKGLKVIPFNEYFDTCVDNKIIAENTLNGMYLNTVVKDIDELDLSIENDEILKEKRIQIVDDRRHGKKRQYKLGSIYQNDTYLLTAFSKFDESNKAYLNMNDYMNFLLNFWNEIDTIYAGRTVVIPLLGSGITRFKEYNMISEQELLELLLWSFKVSKIKFIYPSHVSIVIHEAKMDKVNFYKLRSVENGL